MPDFIFTNHGSICTVAPTNPEAEEWVRYNVDPGAQWFGRGVAVEPRYVNDLVEAAICDGLTVG
jgi:hypothetical protein